MHIGPIARATVRISWGLAIASALIPAMFAAGTAGAQDVPKSISPLDIEPDRNGVNLATGKMAPPTLVLSVPAAPRLKFDRVQNAAPYVTGEEAGNYDTGDRTVAWTVHTADGQSEAFRCGSFSDDSRACTNVKRSGSMLNYGGRTYRHTGTGETYSFSLIHIYQVPSPGDLNQQRKRLFYASRIEYPDGEVISYTYGTATLPGDPYSRNWYRPVRIESNRGYFITISYTQNDLTQADWGSPNEVAIFNANAPATPLGRLTQTGPSSVTDLGGRVYQGYDLGTLGVDTEIASYSRTLPTESSAAVTVTPATNLPTNSQMIGSVNADGVQWSYSYTNPTYYAGLDGYTYAGITVSGPDGFRRSYQIEAAGSLSTIGIHNVIKQSTDELSRRTKFEYDANLRVTKITQPEGNSVSIGWDDAGNIISKTSIAKPSSGLSSLVEQAYVDLSSYYSAGVLGCLTTVACYRPTWYRDALGRQTDYVYNSRGQLTEQTDPVDADGVRRKTYIEYESYDTGTGIISRKKAVRVCGATTTCGTNAEIRTEYEYWGSTNLISVERQVDLTTGQVRETRYTYDAAGRVLSIDGPLPGSDDTEFFRYDVLGRKIWEVGPLAPNGLRMAKRISYRDADDKIASVESGTVSEAASTTLTVIERSDTSYDSRRNPIRVTTVAGGQVLRATDSSFIDRGLPSCTAIRMNLAALPPATATGACSLSTLSAQGPDRITNNVYDAAGQLLAVRQALRTNLMRSQVSYGYTANGKQQFVTDANGNKAQLVYDGFDRQTHWYFPHPTAVGTVSTTDYEQYGYDAAGNRISLRRRDGRTLIFAYDGLNRVVSKVVPDGCAPIQIGACAPASATRDVYYSYDITGHQLRAKFDSLAGVDGLTNSYDAFGQLRTSTISMGGFSKTYTSDYDQAGNRVMLTHPDGQAFTYAYDALGRLGGIYEGWDTSVSLDQFSYNVQGLLAGRTERLGSTVSYGYDAIGRVASQSDSFVGGIGNVAINSITYNPASQLTGRTRNNDAYAWRDAIVVNRGYSANGLNQYTSAGPSSFTYDANGNLVGDGSNTFVYDAENRLISASNGATLVYDPMGRLWQVAKGASSTRFLYDGDALVAEYDASGTLTARYVHGSNAAADDPLVSYDSNGIAHWLHADMQGSIVAVTDGIGGSPSINTYDEYGIPGATNVGRFQYTSQAWLAELGMYYYKARIYSPTLGRFLQVDPIGYKDQFNLYAYVGNDPINRTDTTGLCAGSRIEGSDGQCAGGGFVAGSGSCGGNCAVVAGAAAAAAPGRAASGAIVEAGVTAATIARAGVLGSTLLLCGDSPDGCSNREDYWYLTYTKQKIVDGRVVVYSGRTAGYGKTPESVLNNRDRSHHMNSQGFGKASIDRAVKSVATVNDVAIRAAIRGREQMLIDHYGGARSQGGTSGNAINGISPYNPLRPVYIGAAEAMFGQEF